MAGVSMTGYFVCLFKETLKAGITRRVGTFCMLQSTTVSSLGRQEVPDVMKKYYWCCIY